MKSNSWVIIEIGLALLVLAVLGFFVNPAYEKGVYAIMGALILAFGNALGTQSGGRMPEQANGIGNGNGTGNGSAAPPKG